MRQTSSLSRPGRRRTLTHTNANQGSLRTTAPTIPVSSRVLRQKRRLPEHPPTPRVVTWHVSVVRTTDSLKHTSGERKVDAKTLLVCKHGRSTNGTHAILSNVAGPCMVPGPHL